MDTHGVTPKSASHSSETREDFRTQVPLRPVTTLIYSQVLCPKLCSEIFGQAIHCWLNRTISSINTFPKAGIMHCFGHRCSSPLRFIGQCRTLVLTVPFTFPQCSCSLTQYVLCYRYVLGIENYPLQTKSQTVLFSSVALTRWLSV